MTWKIFEKIMDAPPKLRFELVVDELIPVLAWSMHDYCGTEVLFYVRRVVEETLEQGDPATLRFYAIIRKPEEDLLLPKQRVSEYDVEVLEPPPLDHGYVVVHTHPRGVSKFSSVDREHINVNHTISILVESGRVTDASIALGAGALVVQVRPEVKLAKRRVSLELSLPGGGTVESPAPAEALLRYYASHLLKGPLSGALERVEGCRRRRRGRGG